MDISIAAVPFPLFKGITIELFQLFSNCLFGIGKGKEDFVPQCRQDPRRRIGDTALGMALVLWTANAGRDYCSAIVVCEFCIAAVQDGIHAGIFQHTGTEIVRDRQPGYAAEILIGMYMAEQPVFRLHVTAELSINIAAAGKDPYKKVCGNSLS